MCAVKVSSFEEKLTLRGTRIKGDDEVGMFELTKKQQNGEKHSLILQRFFYNLVET